MVISHSSHGTLQYHISTGTRLGQKIELRDHIDPFESSRVNLTPCEKFGDHFSYFAFLFLYFSKTFFTEIYFRFHNLQFYTPTARQGGGKGPAARQGAAGTYM